MTRQQPAGNEMPRLEDTVPKTTVRAPMPPSRRAKQFVPFDALKGLKEAIAAKEKRAEPRRELSDYMKAQISKALSELRKGEQITVVYYGSLEQETLQLTGTVTKVDAYWQKLGINQVMIDFQEIYEIHEI